MHVACCIGNLMLRPFAVLRGNEGELPRFTRRRAQAKSISVQPVSGRSCRPPLQLEFPSHSALRSEACSSRSVRSQLPRSSHTAHHSNLTEEISTFFPGSTLWQSFVCAVVAAITFQYIDPFNTGKLVLFQVTTSQIWRGFELIPWLFLGVCGGLWGAWFIRLNEEWERMRRGSGLSKWPVTEVAALSLFTAVVSYLVIFMRIPSSELVANLFQDCSAVDSYGLCE